MTNLTDIHVLEQLFEPGTVNFDTDWVQNLLNLLEPSEYMGVE